MAWAEAGTDCSPVADPARIAVRTLAGDMVAGMPVAAGWTAVATTLAVETGGAGLVTFGSVPAGFARQTAAFDYRARLLAFALATPTEGSGSWAGWNSASPFRFPATRLATLTDGDSPGRRSQRGMARDSTCPGSPDRRRTCRPPGGSDHGSTGNNDHSARRTCARDTGSGRSAARRATSCRRTGCCSFGPTSLRGTGRRLSVDRTAK